MAVKIADQEYAQGNQATAEMAFQMGESVADIAIGLLLPAVSFGKMFMRLLQENICLQEEHSPLLKGPCQLWGLFFPGLTYGILNSQTIKLSVSNVNKLSNMLNTRISKGLKEGALSRKSLYAILGLKNSSSELSTVIRNNVEAYFRALDEIGLATKEEMEMATSFLQRVFTKRNPKIEKVITAIKSAGKSGIKNYQEALNKLAKNGEVLTLKQEKELAQFLIDQNKHLAKSGKQLSADDLIRKR